ncbi:hypothetical protein DICVIV_09072 [Dictyocaulus viviparus]|uniref:Uncharacterized protein n=1 Tax=Dictyocaulus viviparus TaxID=29172 RepID=A0A0D8XJW2_DICVI|nr:hypothetical protein DICVIV_09072 [Dictyocaulus viviparus]
MTDPLLCLRNSSIGIAIWNIIYAVVQMAVMGWQTKVVRERQWEYEGRELPATGEIDGFQARFPGLYAIYTETPERRRINAMFVIVLVTLFLAFVHFFTSFSLLYGGVKYNKYFILPWFFSAGPIIAMSTVYAVMWWSGDVFNEQLTMSVAEFVMSLAINGICLVIVIFFYWRLTGKLTSSKPARHLHHRHSKLPPYQSEQYDVTPVPMMHKQRSTRNSNRPPRNIPDWREEWPAVSDPPLLKKLRRRERRSHSDPRMASHQNKNNNNSLDFFAPEPYESKFPWKTEELDKRGYETQPQSAAKIIERMYYKKYPDDIPGIPIGLRSSLRRERKRGRSPNRVTFGQVDDKVDYSISQRKSQKNSFV